MYVHLNVRVLFFALFLVPAVLAVGNELAYFLYYISSDVLIFLAKTRRSIESCFLFVCLFCLFFKLAISGHLPLKEWVRSRKHCGLSRHLNGNRFGATEKGSLHFAPVVCTWGWSSCSKHRLPAIPHSIPPQKPTSKEY